MRSSPCERGDHGPLGAMLQFPRADDSRYTPG